MRGSKQDDRCREERYPHEKLPWGDLKRAGYWTEQQNPDWPDPCTLPQIAWDPKDLELVSMYLRTRIGERCYRGMASCRICGAMLGSCCYTDGEWRWPAGYEHYLIAHGLDLPSEFKAHIWAKLGLRRVSQKELHV